MASNRVHNILISIGCRGSVTDDDVRRLNEVLTDDDAFTRDEIEDILRTDRRIVERCPAWHAFLSRIIVDHIVWECRPTGYVQADDAAWLMGCLGGDKAQIGGRARDIARAVIVEAEKVDQSLIAFAMGAVPPRALGFARAPGHIIEWKRSA